MLLDVSRLILYSLPLIDPPSVKHSLSLSLFRNSCASFSFSLILFLWWTDATEKQAGTQAASIFWDTSHSHLLSISFHHRLKDATETRSTTQNPSQMQAGQICPPRTSKERGGARCHGRYLQAFFCPPPLALTSGLSTPLCFSFFRQPINAEGEREAAGREEY